jgi:predicted TIM-barrel fold metal-dependent hydrolase
MIDDIKIFDAHMHCIGRFKKREETLMQFMDRFGIDKAVVTSLNQEASLNAILSSDVNLNENEFLEKFIPKNQYDHEEVRKMVQSNPDRIYGFFWFNTKIASEEDWGLLENYIKDQNFRGVKTQCFVDLLKVPTDLYRLAEFCIEKDVPLFVHSGAAFYFQKPVRAKDYFNLAKKYPELKLIIGHAGYTMEYCINCLRYFARNKHTPNVFFETSVSIPYAIMTLIKAMGSDRVLYGSDAPTATTPDIEIDKIRILNLDKKTLENVFYNNINKLIRGD